MQADSSRLAQIRPSLIRQMHQKRQPDSLDLGLGALPDAPPPEVILAAQTALLEPAGYTPNAGLEVLRSAIAREASERAGRRIHEAQVIVTCGAEQALANAMLGLLNPGDEVLIPALAFPAYAALARMAGAHPIEYALDQRHQMDPEQIGRLLTARSKLLILNSPANPTGQVISLETLEALHQLTQAHPRLRLVADEVYSCLYFADSPPPTLLRFAERCIVIDSLSKRSALAGWRLGWSIAPEAETNTLLKVQQYLVSCANRVAQLASLPVLQGKCRPSEAQLRNRLRRQRDRLLQSAEGWGLPAIVPPAGAFYALLPTGPLGASEALADRLLAETGVLTIPGKAFGQAGDGYLRLSFAVSEEVLQTALNRLTQFFEQEISHAT